MNPLNVQVGNSTPNLPARGFAATFGLHPMVAALTLAVDLMLGAEEMVTFGGGWLFSLLVSAAVGYLSYRAQMKFFADDAEAAQVKAGMLALLLAIPSPIPSVLYLPAGVLGLFRSKR